MTSTVITVWRSGTLLAALLATALQAGLFYAFTVAVVPGLARAEPRTFVDGMQQINVAIVNPWFLLTFLGAPALTLAAMLVRLLDGGPRTGVVAIAVALGLAVLTIVVTGALSIPLNDALAAAGLDDPGAARDRFLAPWLAWNFVRTLATTGAVGFLGYALMLSARA